jgi:zinc finger HIT domain-containing protein 1
MSSRYVCISSPYNWYLSRQQQSNYTETAAGNGQEDEDEGGYSKGRARQTISDKRKLNIPGTSPAATNKKSTMNVRSALLYRKNFATLLEESVRPFTIIVPLHLTMYHRTSMTWPLEPLRTSRRPPHLLRIPLDSCVQCAAFWARIGAGVVGWGTAPSIARVCTTRRGASDG